MNIFGNYARYYDLLYKDKNYAGEADYIDSLLRFHAPGCASILELGCGSGIHASLLTQKGYEVHGVDLSPDMLKIAMERVEPLAGKSGKRISFAGGDVRSYRTDRKFDAVISLFHVMSYQTRQEDLHAAFETARFHMAPGAIFIFDFWYGPAVLTDRPAVRVKRLEDEKIKVARIAEPSMHPNENCVDVNYQIFVADKASGRVEDLNETHKMRYLFLPEIDSLMENYGMMRLRAEEWMTGKEPGFDTWGVCVVAQG